MQQTCIHFGSRCQLFLLFFCAYIFGQNIQAQIVLQENFNNCILPAGWTTSVVGNPNPVWGVGIPTNPNSDGQSIDGSCMFYFDDDAMGYDAAAWVGTLTSPAFDASGGGTFILELDLHFRDWGGADGFYIYASDAVGTYHQIGAYTGQSYSGYNYDQFVHVVLNLTPYANANMRIQLVYDDNNTWNWWAAFDNFVIKNYSTYIEENFNDCTLPANWQNLALNGNYDWDIGNDTIWPTNMNGSCMVYFNDEKAGGNALPASLALVSPPFDGTLSATLALDVDINFREYAGSYLGIVLFDGINYHTLQAFSGQNYNGNNYQDYYHASIDLSPYRNQTMQIIYVYNDGGTWAQGASIDNHRVTGFGEMNDVCSRAEILTVNAPCATYSNVNAIFTGPNPSCVDSTDASLWFRFVAPASGAVSVVTQATFNEVISVFSGTCAAMNPIACTNYDEFGFTDETLRLSGLTAGQAYLVRVSGAANTFVLTEGQVCIRIISPSAAAVSPPQNDDCANAITLDMGNNCVQSSNKGATFEPNEPVPSLNNRSRASVWYRFVAPAGGKVRIENDADFADVLAVYSGSCANLIEVAANDYGRTLDITGLTVGNTYYLQVTGYFATLEGSSCVRINLPPAPPTNELCTNPINVIVGAAQCTAANNDQANFVGTTADLTLPFTGYAATTQTEHNYTRPEEGATCVLSDKYPSYNVFLFRVSTTGTYTIVNTYEPNFDGYLHIYANSFDPQNPCATYFVGNDDFNGIGQSRIIATFSANTTYYLVTSAWSGYASGTFSTTISGAGAVLRVLDDVNINGMNTSCDLNPAHPIWFTFTAPASGKAKVHTGADFEHIVSLYDGVCGALNELACFDNPSRCSDGVLFENLTAGATYFIQIVSASTPVGYVTGNVCLHVKDAGASPVRIKLKAYLEGAYMGNGTMNALLAPYLIPKQQPYNGTPWNYNGSECIDLPPSNMTDWVLVELRDAANVATIVARKAAILLNTGMVVDNDRDGVYFDVPAGNYHIVLRHRNHLAVITPAPQTLPNAGLYSFASDVSTAMGMNQLKALADGNYGLIAGDFNGNGVITVADFNLYMPQTSAINQYKVTDCNLDRNVTVADFNLYKPNSSIIGVAPIRY